MSFEDNAIYWVEVSKIVPNPYQPRREFDEEKLKELGDSIRMYGVLQPLTVTRNEIQSDDGSFRTEYELIAGERRLRASKLAGVEQVPVLIRTNEDTAQDKLELAIIENVQREDLNAVDRAMAFHQLAETFNLSHVQVAKKVGRSREYVSNSIRLLLLPNYMLQSLKDGDITEGHARALLMLKERPEEQDVVFREILLKKLSVREVERISRKIATDKVRKKTWKDTDPVLIEIERELTDSLGTRVQIQKTDFGGKLTIDYFSEEDLKRLLVLVKDKGKLSEMLGGDDPSEVEGEESDEVMVQKLVSATPLAAAGAVYQSVTERDLPSVNPETQSPEVQTEPTRPEQDNLSENTPANQMPPEELAQTAVENAQISSQAMEDAVLEHAVSYSGAESESVVPQEEEEANNVYENLDKAVAEAVPQTENSTTSQWQPEPERETPNNIYENLDKAINAVVEPETPTPQTQPESPRPAPVPVPPQPNYSQENNPPQAPETPVTVPEPQQRQFAQENNLPQSPSVTEKKEESKKDKDDDSQLYSMNNFSL